MRRTTSTMGTFVIAGALMVAGGTTAHAVGDPEEGLVDQALAQVDQRVAPNEVPLAGSKEIAGTAVAPTLLGPVSITPHDVGESVVRLRGDGVQVLTVLDEGSTSASFSVDAPEGAVLRQEGDLIALAVEAEGSVLTFAQFEEPWAVDAKGVHLPTEYRLDGDTIIQSVDTSDATFPVVADPRLTPRASGANGGGLYLSLTGAEMKAVVNGLIAIGGVSAIVGCSVAKLPQPVARIVALACGAIGAPTLKAVLRAMVANAQSTSLVNGACYEAKVLPQGPFRRVAASRC